MLYNLKVEVYRCTPYRKAIWAGAALLSIVSAVVVVFNTFDMIKSPRFNPRLLSLQAQSQLSKPFSSANKLHKRKKGLTPAKKKNSGPLAAIAKGFRSVTCIFKGKAMFQGIPYPQAEVLVRVSTQNSDETLKTLTQHDGTYRLEVPVQAKENEPVDWSMEASTPELPLIEAEGRKIVLAERTIPIEQAIAFSDQ